MGDVVTIPRKILLCICGCSTFEMYLDGTTECSNCGETSLAEGTGWAPDPKVETKAEREPFKDVQGNGSIEFTKRRLQRLATSDDVDMIVLAFRDGSVTTWSVADTIAQFDWVASRISIAQSLFAVGRNKLKDR